MRALQDLADTVATPDSITVNTDPGIVLDKVYALANSFLRMLPNLALALVVFAVFAVVARLIRSSVRRAAHGRRGANVAIVMARLTQIVVLFVGLLVAVGIIFPTVRGAELLQLLGIGSVAIGFAFRDIAQNFLAGLLILMRQPFREGDQIVYKDFEGTVESIETRATHIKTYDGTRVIIPNGEIYTSAVRVNTAFNKRRSEFVVGIGYGDDLVRAKAVLVEAVTGIDGVLAEPPPEALTVGLNDFTVDVAVWWWTKPDRASVVHVSSEVITAIKLALDAHGIDMPYPTQQMLFHDQTEDTDGDRTRQREGWPAGDTPPMPARVLAHRRRSSSPEEERRP